MENKIKFLYGYICIEDAMIKIDQICLIRPNSNRHISGVEILLSSGDILEFKKTLISQFDIFSRHYLVRIGDFFVNVSKVIAITPIPPHYGFSGTHIYFQGSGKIDLGHIDTALAIKEIIGVIQF